MLLQHPLKTLSKDCVTRMLICRYENRLFHRPQFVPRCVIPSSLSPTNLPSRRDNGVLLLHRTSSIKRKISVKRSERSFNTVLRFFSSSFLEHLFIDTALVHRTSCRGFSSRSFLQFEIRCENIATNISLSKCNGDALRKC